MKAGLIGAGLQGKRRSRALKEFNDTELLVVADTDRERAERLAKEMACESTTDWNKVIGRDDVDVVIICTPPDSHREIGIAAARQGKHVLCEKPLARNPEEAEVMVSAAEENGVKLKCGFNLRHHPGIQQCRNWLDGGIIGEPIFIRCCYGIGGGPNYDKDWRVKPEISGGGELMDQGMHTLDLARYFLGEFNQASGFIQTGYWEIAPAEDNAFVLLKTAKGQVASIHVSWTQWRNLFSFEIFGKDGYARVEGLGGSYGVEKAVLGKREFLKPFEEKIIDFRGADKSWQEEWREFTTAIEEVREPSGNGHDGLAAIKLAYAVYESASSGMVIRL